MALAPGRGGNRAQWLGWALIVLVAIALRAAWWEVGVRVIEDEGANYARVGENLAAGRGYLGLDELGAQLIYPPLYPGLIAAGIRLGLTAETSGRAASLLFGAFAPLLFGLIARRLYGARAGWLAGVLTAVHPLLIAVSVAVLSEAVYLSLILAGLHQALLQLELPRRRAAALGGVSLGLAYLCRPEALFLTVVLAVLIVLSNRHRLRDALIATAWMIGVFAVFALPYVAYLHRQTGQWRFEAKTGQGVIWQVGAAAGRDPGELYWGVDPDLTERGISNTSDVAQLHFAAPPGVSRARIAAGQVRTNLPKLIRGLGHLQFGMPFLAMLIGIGLFARAWDRRRTVHELPLLAVSGLTIGPFLLWPFTLDRSLFMLLVPFLPWAASGLDVLGGWARESARALGARGRVVALAGGLLVTGAVGGVVATSVLGVHATDELSQSWSTLAAYKPVGEWIRTQAPHARIMDVGPTVAFYGGGVLVRYPWSDRYTALRYLAAKKVDYVVLREQMLASRPYLRSWFDDPPDRRLELVKAFTGETGTTRIYRWNDSAPTRVDADEPVRVSPAAMPRRGTAPRPIAFPVGTSPGVRHLVDARGHPVLIHGDSPWALITQLRMPDVERYLADRQRKGFNAILVELLESYFSADAPNNAYGDAPFLTPGDFSTPNEAYFAHAEAVIRSARDRGMIVLLAPAYMGYDGAHEGWYRTLVANGAGTLRDYGAYLARRFRRYDNIIWVHGGDYNPPERGLLRAVASGIHDVAPKWLHTFHGARRTSALGFLGADEPWLTLNTIYTDSAVIAAARAERARSTMPFFLIEAIYEDASSEELVRRQAYHAVLAGATGQVMGINPVWSFSAGWERALDSPGATTLRHLRDLFAAYDWATLEPDDRGALVTASTSAGSGEIAAAVSADGTFAIAYLPGAGEVTLDLRALSGPKVMAWWYDPTSGEYSPAAHTPLARDSRVPVRAPGRNRHNRADWVLVLDSTR